MRGHFVLSDTFIVPVVDTIFCKKDGSIKNLGR
ncbi:hypothetical protein SAMN05421779_104208 [Insolitispirillum peregrinum]|uniref:Uncharacterized protein n=1 Tax=Insolitispirillum peregrinum TaxID=80876 RepID=A0A1N7MLJ6_9PROT|nr:hypothetical protein SAMN05421779_104208 [Insolitispirillum peregrinum]